MIGQIQVQPICWLNIWGFNIRETRSQVFYPYASETVLPTLTSEETFFLEDSFSEQVVEDIVKTFPQGKSPGLDGFTAQYYKFFSPQLSSFMTRVLNSITIKSPFTPQTLMATISVIAKLGKDLSSCASYWPSSFIYTDVKLDANIFASR